MHIRNCRSRQRFCAAEVDPPRRTRRAGREGAVQAPGSSPAPARSGAEPARRAPSHARPPRRSDSGWLTRHVVEPIAGGETACLFREMLIQASDVSRPPSTYLSCPLEAWSASTRARRWVDRRSGAGWPKRGNPHKARFRPLRSRHVATASDPCAGRRRVLDGGRERAAGRLCSRAHGRRMPEGVLPPHRPGDADHYIVRFYRAFLGRPLRAVAHLAVPARRRRRGPRRAPDGQDLIYVGGGADSLLGMWRRTGSTGCCARRGRRCHPGGRVSAGSLCWFAEASPHSTATPKPCEGLGFLPHSNAVHYEEEPTGGRRTTRRSPTACRRRLRGLRRRGAALRRRGPAPRGALAPRRRGPTGSRLTVTRSSSARWNATTSATPAGREPALAA